ncbi:MAG: hypothetical protein ABI721_04870 [Candidatus Dojkabacteria bacterium]
MQILDILLIIIDVSITSLGGVFLKVGATRKNLLVKLFFVGLGIGIYLGMSFITVFLYSKYSIVFVQTALAFTYVTTPLFAMIFLKEKASKKIFLGLLLIVIGVFFVSYGNSIN